MSQYFGENKVEAGHGRRSLRGGVAALSARFANALIQIGSVLFLARLLSPEDYGLVAMVTAVTGFAPTLVSLGTPDAIAQRSSITEGEVNALFWLTLAVGASSTLLIAACGPLISWFYGEPRLTMITVASALTFIASALTCQHYALLRRAMKFRELGIIEVGANLLSAAGSVVMAAFGLHYWALVLRPVTMNLLLASGVWFRCRWLPGKPTITSGVKEMVKLGMHSTGFTLLDFVGGSSDRVAIGYRGGAMSLGFYQNAMFVYTNLLDVLVTPLHGVAVTSLSKVRGDLKELRRLWAKALSTLVFYSMPAFAILALTSTDLIGILLGKKWISAGSLLSILALRGIPNGVERTLGWLHVTAGRADRWVRWGVLATCAQLVALFCGLPFGARGVVIAYVVCMFILFIPAIAYAGRPLGIGAKDAIEVVWRPLTGTLFAVAVGFALRYTVFAGGNFFSRSILPALVFVAIYLFLVVGLFGVRTPLLTAFQLAGGFIPDRFTRRATMLLAREKA